MNSMDWKQQYEMEQARLIDSLGWVTEGGIVEAIQHIGATSVPGLAGSSCVDIAMAVWPFPWKRAQEPELRHLGIKSWKGIPKVLSKDFGTALEQPSCFLWNQGRKNG